SGARSPGRFAGRWEEGLPSGAPGYGVGPLPVEGGCFNRRSKAAGLLTRPFAVRPLYSKTNQTRESSPAVPFGPTFAEEVVLAPHQTRGRDAVGSYLVSHGWR